MLASTRDGRHISVIRVESDGTQRLWQFTLDGREPTALLPGIKPVGYPVWTDASILALFVLGGEGRPATLQDTGWAAARVRQGTDLQWRRGDK
jgi:hypothetical protein